MRFLLAMAFMAGGILAQTPPIFEIRGTITQPGLGGIAGVPLLIQFVGKPGVLPNELVPSTFTDGRGQFVFRTEQPGTHLIVVTMPGYSRVSTQARVDQDHPRADVPISLVRLGQITGRVFDADTREPIPDVDVFAMQRIPQPDGGFTWQARSSVILYAASGLSPAQLDELARRGERNTTDKNGVFTIPGLMPGDYAVSVRKGPNDGSATFSAEFSPEDLDATDESTSVFWSTGKQDLERASFSLASGGFFNVGNIPLQKATKYRALISMPQGACPIGESVRLTLYTVGTPSTSSFQVFPCGKDLLLRGLQPGSYVLYGVSDWQGERDNVQGAFWGTTSFEVTDKNTKVLLSLERGIIIDGRLTAASGVESLPAQIGIVMKPSELAPGVSPSAEQFIEWGENGRFRMAISPRAQTMQVMGVRDNFSVKEVRYNGSPLPNLTIPINTGTTAQNLEVVLDNRLPLKVDDLAEAAKAAYQTR